MRTLKTLASMTVIVLFSGVAAEVCAEFKVGICNTAMVVRESEEGKKRLEDYQRLMEKKEKELEVINQRVSRLQDQIKQLGTSIREERRTELERQLQDAMIEGKRKTSDAERALALVFDDLQQEMARLIVPIIQEVGRSQGFALILNAQQPGILYFDETIDMTHEVIQRFNERVKTNQ